MKIIILIIIILSIPFIAWAQFDFNVEDWFLNDFDFDINDYIAIKDFELIWSADTYTPYEYQGRALPSSGSKVFVQAIVNTSGGDAGSLKYSWFLEDIFQKSKSGYGKDSFDFYVNQIPGAYHTVRLQIFNEDRSVFEEKSIKIPVVEPELVIDSFIISAGREFSFKAEPYFFSIKKITDLEFEWHFPGQDPIISSTYDASVLDLSITEKQDKEIVENELWISVRNKIQPRQKAYQTIKVWIY